ncbi:ArsR/SmtB family transcription factor [Ancylobacter sp. G4_0304]|uniref:ArsR/SmtB family transcription factor n=1 Tax=Ancylobacter sp. G4_0304 TaxID=3114289 RepID=UPI0039C6FEED
MSAPIDDELLALRLRALGHPARLAILRALARADRCHCGEIVRGLPLAQSTVSQHLKILKDAGLIDGTVEGPRSCYCLDRTALADALAALACVGSAMRPEPEHIAVGAPIYDHVQGEAAPPASLE